MKRGGGVFKDSGVEVSFGMTDCDWCLGGLRIGML